MKNFVFTILVAAILVAAGFVADNTSSKSDLPFEAGMLQAPEIQRGHGGAAAEGHGTAVAEGHEAAVEEDHGAAVEEEHGTEVEEGHGTEEAPAESHS
ncbi:MAG: hypothetical protein KKC99_08305 [Proteobacteria bacterium]|nr:hypothetical protein [Pseudomonadota bacterium]